MKKLEIEIPNNKEIDWEASAKQKQIVFKDKQLTYEDVCEKLFDKGHYFIDTSGDIAYLRFAGLDANSASTQHQLECILAKNMLANVARYLNNEWEPDLVRGNAWVLVYVPETNHITTVKARDWTETPNILFNSTTSAKQAIEILGEETVKLALEPLF